MKWLNLCIYRYILFQSQPPSQMLPMFFFVLPIPLRVGVFSLTKAPIAHPFLSHNTKTSNTRPTLKMCLHHLILKRWLFNRSFQCLSGYMQQKFLFLKVYKQAVQPALISLGTSSWERAPREGVGWNKMTQGIQDLTIFSSSSPHWLLWHTVPPAHLLSAPPLLSRSVPGVLTAPPADPSGNTSPIKFLLKIPQSTCSSHWAPMHQHGVTDGSLNFKQQFISIRNETSGGSKKGIPKEKKKKQRAADGAARRQLQMFGHSRWPESHSLLKTAFSSLQEGSKAKSKQHGERRDIPTRCICSSLLCQQAEEHHSAELGREAVYSS